MAEPVSIGTVISVVKGVLELILKQDSVSNESQTKEIISAVAKLIDNAKKEILDYLEEQEIRQLKGDINGVINNIRDYNMVYSKDFANLVLVNIGTAHGRAESIVDSYSTNLQLSAKTVPIFVTSASLYIFFVLHYLKMYIPSNQIEERVRQKQRIHELLESATRRGGAVQSALYNYVQNTLFSLSGGLVVDPRKGEAIGVDSCYSKPDGTKSCWRSRYNNFMPNDDDIRRKKAERDAARKNDVDQYFNQNYGQIFSSLQILNGIALSSEPMKRKNFRTLQTTQFVKGTSDP